MNANMIKPLVVFFCASMMVAYGQGGPIQIDVSKQGGVKTGMHFGSFRTAGAGVEFLQVLRQDLSRSGHFVEAGAGAAVQFSGVAQTAGGSIEAQVIGESGGRRVYARSVSGNVADVRALAHQVADDIVKALKGVPGFASTRLVLVGVSGKNKELYICDSDGANLQPLTRDNTLSLSPRWTPDGSRILYTSYAGGAPKLAEINLQTGQRSWLATYPGMNTGGALSPDGRTLAMVLSKDGRPEIYAQDMSSKRLTRLTRTAMSAKANPTWSPDGNRLAFVSGHDGRPHVFVIGRNGGDMTKLTFQGNENVSPDWGPSGELVYVTRQQGRYQIAVMNPTRGGAPRIVSRGAGDYESPSWARNGRHIVATRSVNFRKNLILIDTAENGDPEVELIRQAGNWDAGDWQP